MVSFDQRIVLAAETQFLVSVLIVVLLLLVLVVGYAGVMNQRLSAAITTQNELMYRADAKRVDGKRE
jgi:hypothetical protein